MIKLLLQKLCHWNLHFRAETGSVRTGWKFPLQNELTLPSWVWTSRSKSKTAHEMILTWCLRRFSKSIVIFRKTQILGLRKKSVFQEISTFSVFFTLVDRIINLVKIRLSNVFSNSLLFFLFLSLLKITHFIIIIDTSKYCWTDDHEHANDWWWNAFWYHRD